VGIDGIPEQLQSLKFALSAKILIGIRTGKKRNNYKIKVT